MKAATLIVLLFIALGFGAGIFYFVNSEKPSSFTITRPSPSPQIVAADQTNQVSSSKYIEYDPQALENTAGKRRVLFFYADWCPTCRPVDAEIKANLNKLPADVSVIKVNYNDDFTDEEEKALAQKYGVTYQHTFVQIDEADNEITKWNGGGLDNLLQSIE